MENPIPTPPQKKRLCEIIAREIAAQENERDQENAYTEPPEKFDPSNPGSRFGKRVSNAIQQKSFEQ